MIAVERTALVVLAAGRSRRFGDADKLSQPFLGKPLGFHVLTALESLPFLGRHVVTSDTNLDFAGRGYRLLNNDDPAAGLARSVRLGVAAARETGAEAVAIVLADMPRVTASHLLRLLDAADGDDAVVASSDGVQPSPPAVFGRGRFDLLMQLDGDAGARDLVRAGRHVVTAPAELIDIDSPDDLERLRDIARAPHRHGAITRPA